MPMTTVNGNSWKIILLGIIIIISRTCYIQLYTNTRESDAVVCLYLYLLFRMHFLYICVKISVER